MNWLTSDEIHFVRNLGKHREIPSDGAPDKVSLLRLYRATMPLRYRWVNIDSALVAKAVTRELNRLGVPTIGKLDADTTVDSRNAG